MSTSPPCSLLSAFRDWSRTKNNGRLDNYKKFIMLSSHMFLYIGQGITSVVMPFSGALMKKWANTRWKQLRIRFDDFVLPYDSWCGVTYHACQCIVLTWCTLCLFNRFAHELFENFIKSDNNLVLNTSRLLATKGTPSSWWGPHRLVCSLMV